MIDKNLDKLIKSYTNRYSNAIQCSEKLHKGLRQQLASQIKALVIESLGEEKRFHEHWCPALGYARDLVCNCGKDNYNQHIAEMKEKYK